MNSSSLGSSPVAIQLPTSSRYGWQTSRNIGNTIVIYIRTETNKIYFALNVDILFEDN